MFSMRMPTFRFDATPPRLRVAIYIPNDCPAPLRPIRRRRTRELWIWIWNNTGTKAQKADPAHNWCTGIIPAVHPKPRKYFPLNCLCLSRKPE